MAGVRLGLRRPPQLPMGHCPPACLRHGRGALRIQRFRVVGLLAATPPGGSRLRSGRAALAAPAKAAIPALRSTPWTQASPGVAEQRAWRWPDRDFAGIPPDGPCNARGLGHGRSARIAPARPWPTAAQAPKVPVAGGLYRTLHRPLYLPGSMPGASRNDRKAQTRPRAHDRFQHRPRPAG